MKKNLGILTFWGVPNYGAWTQAYALNNVTRNLLGDEYDVRHINYLHPTHFASYYAKDEKLWNNFSYSWDVIAHTERLSAEELERCEFDTIITGSDAIWEFDIEAFGGDTHLIGNNLNTKNLIAYASSFGTMTAEVSFDGWVYEGLKKYNSISVRDENSAAIVKKLIRTEPQIVLDPALLWDFKNDTNIVEPFIDSYILVYGRNWTEEFIQSAQGLAKEKKCKLVSVGYINKWCDRSYRMTELRCFEWIGMFKNAVCVITSMFHGLMLGLAFEKQVKFLAVPYVQKRAQTLLQRLDIDVGNVEKVFTSDIDYVRVNKKLGQMRKNSLDYLNEALRKESIND